jgi:hypothetical protein
MIRFRDIQEYRDDRKEVKKLLSDENRHFW